MNRKSVILHRVYNRLNHKNLTTAKLHFPLKLKLIKTHAEGRKFFVATLSLRYPGCKSLFIRGLRFRSSLLVAQAFGRGFVDLCSTPRHPAAREGKKFWYPG